MKTLPLSLSLAFSALILFSCRNESRENAGGKTQNDPATEIAEDMDAALPSLPYIAAFVDGSEQLEAEKNPEFNRASLSLDALTQALIANYPEINLEVNRVSNDTLFVQIIDARYLTQQMGSSGAQMYIMEATYAYTELPDINVVHFDFTEGDHALPGSYTRDYFQETRIIR
ncbi:hypothetical protein GCM10007415_15880 [Parapedobacter pyrenivorans]|uniref:Uncharacterized protein n=1 Tax=Parapedobacter pyrenivorans TaxID=1305674 RepID=A0A917HLP5_9SPHI|nr:hypothetical protein [Parapedobacter pyrenivorans]GGG83633.1 hypothetical protein GCM10007415_15880 [Parapedobacter pyrenivorans]